MPYVNGIWVEEDASVAARATQLIGEDSPFMRRAKTTALQQANRRGLLNTSIAVGASEAAAQAAALPIASQEAAQIHARNLAAQEAEQRGRETPEAIAQRTFAASESALQRGTVTSEAALQRASSEEMAEQERGARSGLLSAELLSREREGAAARELAASEGAAQRVESRITETERIDATQRIAAEGIVARETVARLSNDSAVRLANLNIENQQKVAALQVKTGERQKATEAVVNVAAQYEASFATIQNNTDIPADAREASLAHIAAIRDSNFAMIQALYNNEDITWTPIPFGGKGTPGAIGPGTIPPATPPEPAPEPAPAPAPAPPPAPAQVAQRLNIPTLQSTIYRG